MSKTLREILRDPKTRLELEKGLSKLRSQGKDTDSFAIITIGKYEYKIQFVGRGGWDD